MTTPATMSGLLSPVVTPFTADLSPDTARLIRHCKWLLSQNCGLAVFGTNSEANSLSVDERLEMLDALIEAGIDPARMMPGTGCSAITDSVRMTRHAVSKGVGGVLMLPPFYYKNVSDEGLFRNYAEIIEKVGDSRLKIYLYHFPAMSAVPLGLALIERLLKAYPETVVGIKDSSGDLENLKAMLNAFPGFGVFAGTEALLLDNMRLGGVGCISATANVNPGAISNLFDNWESPEADELQAGLNALRGTVQKFPMIPALKKLVSHYMDDSEWNRVRPPLVELTEEHETALLSAVKELGFDMPGIKDVI